MITLEELRTRVERLGANAKAISDSCSSDGHVEEDALYAEVLETIASGKLSREDMIEYAKLALTTQEMDFPCWYE